MKKAFTQTLASGLLAAGLALAQTPQPAPAPQPRAHVRMGMGRMAQQLNLTPDQQTQAKAIFQSTRQSTAALRTQMRDARQALSNAVKSNAPDAQIDQLSANVGALSGQLTAARTKAFAKFYAILTPDQKATLDTLRSQHRGGMRPAAWRHQLQPGGWGGASGQAKSPAPPAFRGLAN
jgi:Spy/CpxP family protein refolding chaperone